MSAPLTVRITAALLFAVASSLVHCAEVNVMIAYACVDGAFRATVPRPEVLHGDTALSNASIRDVAIKLPMELQMALREAANQAIGAMAHEPGKLDSPDLFFDHFGDHVAAQLEKQIDVRKCGEERADYLYDVAINRYFAQTLGKGETYQWFVSHGGPWTYTAWYAAVAALELIGRSPDLEAWKGFYERYSVRYNSPAAPE
ncbi:MAG: hypothetical protein ACJ8HI_07400 [Massilia sp.]